MITGDEALYWAKKLLCEQGEDLVTKINNVIQMVTDLTAVVSNKVDKIPGKGLSTIDFTDANYVHTDNNYTTTEKNKLSNVKLFKATTPNFSSLPKTFYSSSLISGCVLVGNAIELSNPKVGDIDWSVSFANGSLTISGTFHGSGSTNASMSIWIPTETITLTNS